MRRRDFCLGGLAIAGEPVPIVIPKKRKLTHCMTWDSHDTNALTINLKYDDGSSTITTIPYKWLYDRPIKSRLLLQSNPTQKDWTEICQRVVEEYVHGK